MSHQCTATSATCWLVRLCLLILLAEPNDPDGISAAIADFGLSRALAFGQVSCSFLGVRLGLEACMLHMWPTGWTPVSLTEAQGAPRGCFQECFSCVLVPASCTELVLVWHCGHGRCANVDHPVPIGLAPDGPVACCLAVLQSHLSTRRYGTVTHQPVELLVAGKLTPAVDIYSFGIISEY